MTPSPRSLRVTSIPLVSLAVLMPSMYLVPFSKCVFHSQFLAIAHVHIDLLDSLYPDIAPSRLVNDRFPGVLHAISHVHFELIDISPFPPVSVPPVLLDTAILIPVGLQSAHVGTVLLDTDWHCEQQN